MVPSLVVMRYRLVIEEGGIREHDEAETRKMKRTLLLCVVRRPFHAVDSIDAPPHAGRRATAATPSMPPPPRQTPITRGPPVVAARGL